MRRVRTFELIAQIDRANLAGVRVHIPHPELHDVDTVVFTVKAIEVIAELHGDIFV